MRRSKPAQAIKMPNEPTQIGWREWIALPDLGIDKLQAKIDTGARTSALHATDIKVRQLGEDSVVDFTVPFRPGKQGKRCTAKLVGQKIIKNTSGLPEQRFVMKTTLQMGGHSWLIEVSLADRGAMKFALILGRTAVRRHGFLINPGRSYLLGDLTSEKALHPSIPTVSLPILKKTSRKLPKREKL